MQNAQVLSSEVNWLPGSSLRVYIAGLSPNQSIIDYPQHILTMKLSPSIAHQISVKNYYATFNLYSALPVLAQGPQFIASYSLALSGLFYLSTAVFLIHIHGHPISRSREDCKSLLLHSRFYHPTDEVCESSHYRIGCVCPIRHKCQGLLRPDGIRENIAANTTNGGQIRVVGKKHNTRLPSHVGIKITPSKPFQSPYFNIHA